MCVPNWDSPSVFTSLIGGVGTYAVTPMARFVWGGYYEPGSLIWRSRWVTDDGIVECREALAFPGDARTCPAPTDYRRPGRGSCRRPPRGTVGLRQGSLVELSRQKASGPPVPVPTMFAGLSGRGARSSRNRRHLTMELSVGAGQSHDLVLEIGLGHLPDEPIEPEDAWTATTAAWEDAVPPLSACLSPPESRHSYAVLRGLTTSSGGMVAAATTSLPERSEAGRNYDYRYVWIRDQCYAGHAMAAIGDVHLLGDAVRFVTERLLEHGRRLKPAYTATGEQIPDQRSLDLLGYPGGFDRVGNRVNGQFQLDAFGESLLLFADASRYDLLDADGLQAGDLAATAISERWTELDAGILGDRQSGLDA